MALKKITYKIKGKKYSIEAKICKSFWEKLSGLMFRKQSPPLLFVFNKKKMLSIHSLFCRPFRAIWLDDNMNSSKVVDVKTWKLDISGKGKYLLEIPLSLKNSKFPSRNKCQK